MPGVQATEQVTDQLQRPASQYETRHATTKLISNATADKTPGTTPNEKTGLTLAAAHDTYLTTAITIKRQLAAATSRAPALTTLTIRPRSVPSDITRPRHSFADLTGLVQTNCCTQQNHVAANMTPIAAPRPAPFATTPTGGHKRQRH